jgi:hypothetical protein
VYPGATEEVCVPVLERASGKKFNVDFFCGYSPERINPGDKEHRLPTIKKVTSGSTPEAADAVDRLYRQIISAGTHKASSIKVAEAAKVIENTQRDLNIALMNELSLIFRKLGIDTLDVLQAAGTKWNFLPFRPGLVGGHCIGVDPYYLTHKAEQVGYHPQVILAGRRINDHMAIHVADEVIKLMLQKNLPVLNSKVLVLGLSFKENCPDVRNTKVADIVHTLRRYNTQVDVFDPWIDVAAAEREYGLECLRELPRPGQYAAVVVAVGHHQFTSLGAAGDPDLGPTWSRRLRRQGRAADRCGGRSALSRSRPCRWAPTSSLPVSTSSSSGAWWHNPAHGSSPGWPDSSAATCWRPCCNSISAWSGWTPSSPAVGTTWKRCRPLSRRSSGTASAFSKAMFETRRPATLRAKASTMCCIRPR